MSDTITVTKAIEFADDINDELVARAGAGGLTLSELVNAILRESLFGKPIND